MAGYLSSYILMSIGENQDSAWHGVGDLSAIDQRRLHEMQLKTICSEIGKGVCFVLPPWPVIIMSFYKNCMEIWSSSLS